MVAMVWSSTWLWKNSMAKLKLGADQYTSDRKEKTVMYFFMLTWLYYLTLLSVPFLQPYAEYYQYSVFQCKAGNFYYTQ